MSDIRWIRSAFWTGTVKPGSEAEFRAAIDHEIAPAFRRLPGVAGARALWPLRREDDPPPIALQFVVEFTHPDDLARMLASPERAALRPRVKALMALFDGSVSHIEYECA